MKKSISIMLVLSILAGLFAMCGVTAFAEDDILNYLTYKIDNGKVTIMGCDKSISGDVVIPDTIEGYPVTSIFEGFYNCKNITSVTVPDSVRIIGEGSFSSCDNLKTINLGNGITRIEQFLFSGCISLESIEIPDNVTEIGLAPFSDCRSLESIKIGKNVEFIDSLSLSRCVSFKRFIVDEENANFSNDEHGVLFNKDKTELIYYPVGKTESTYIIPEGVVRVGDFSYCSNLKCVEIPASTLEIYFYTFECTDLEKITFYNKLCSIDFNENTIPETAVIYGYKNSTAELYAEKYNRKFVALDNDAFSAFLRLFDSFVHLIKTLFNQLLNMFSFK